MPLIRLEYDDAKVSDVDAETLSRVVRDIVSEETGIADVFVYGNTARIKIQVAPIEIFVQMTDKKITDIDELFNRIQKRISDWKISTSFIHPVNFTLIPMNWKFEVNI